ncbi:1-propanol dehydrogenase PduQ [Testudinibacter sp. P27/CKL/0425]
MTTEFSVKAKVYSGASALQALACYHHKRVGIVTDPFMVSSGLISKITEQLSDCQIELFSEIKPDPDTAVLKAGAAFFQAFRPEIMIACGGGSALDAAKGIVVTLSTLQPSAQPLLIAIPTTSGSGSEVTAYAVISDSETQVKYPLVSDDLLADVAILDPSLVVSLPQRISVETGMDVMTHAIEAMVSRQANDFSDGLAEKALALVFNYLPQIYSEPKDLTAREKLHNASCMAGMAFNSSGLGLVHGMAHALGALLHIPHGRMNAVLLPMIIEFNAQDNNEIQQKYAVCARIGGCRTLSATLAVNQLVLKIKKMNSMMGIEQGLRSLGCDLKLVQQQREQIVQAVLNDGCTKTNPRQVAAEDVERLLDRLIKQ